MIHERGYTSFQKCNQADILETRVRRPVKAVSTQSLLSDVLYQLCAHDIEPQKREVGFEERIDPLEKYDGELL
jgi:hypothetical protein